MPLFRKLTDEEQADKWVKEAELLKRKNYDLLQIQKDYPEKSFLLTPNRIFATSFDMLEDKDIRINIGYKSNFSGYVTETIRVNYDTIIKGSLLCSDVKNIQEVPYQKNSEIKIGLFSTNKEIIFPVQRDKTFLIKCKKIYIEDINSYATYEDKLIPEDDYRLILKQQFK